MQLSRRMSVLGTETAFEVLAKARKLEAEGKKIVHLEIGEPDFNTPENIKKAGMEAIRKNYSHYGPSGGLPEFRKAIAEHVSENRNVDIKVDEVVVTPGAKPIIFYGMLACINPGDEVIYPNPGFPIYESMIRYVGGKPVPVPLREAREFRFSVDDIKARITKKTKMIILNSPQNPTGGILRKQDIQEIAALAQRHKLWVMSDEVYSRIIYDGTHESIISEGDMKDRTILIDGFSKTYAMTGWRLGYGVMPSELSSQVAKLMTNSNSCTATFTQIAGIEALQGPQQSVQRMVKEFKKRRDVIVRELNKIPGVTCKRPGGAFYAFPNVKLVPKNSIQLQDFLLKEANVACLSGTSFGEEGYGYLRFSYANSVENIKKGMAQVRETIKAI
ncbi:MAG: pyridoxal phosphate-dependent aminotransferase [Nanoarchaeota archaeon]